MDTKSHKPEELTVVLINSVKTLSNKMDSMESQIKLSNELNAKTVDALVELNTTITGTNKVFDEVSEGIEGLYEKVKQLEIWGKLLGSLGGLGPLLGGLGGLGSSKK